MFNRSRHPIAGASLTLATARPGQDLICTDIGGGRGMRRRLADMGILPGRHLTVISGGGQPGPIVVRIGDSKLMIGRGMAQRVAVRPA